jgi:hypothetical protein
MAINLNTAASAGSIFHPQTLSYTARATDTRIVAAIATSATPQNLPSPVTYNSVTMNQLGIITSSSGLISLLFYYLDNPSNSLGWGSALNLTAGYTANGTGYINAAVSMSGHDTTRIPVIGTGSEENPTTTPTYNQTGAGTSDIYLGAVFGQPNTTITATGTGQTSLTQTIAVNGGISLSLDEILGTNSGSFSWSTTNMDAAVLGVIVFGAPPPPTNYSLESSEYF